ncbi:hypothetical protein BGW39_003559, partial [Mortierella sp. 14UC]
SLVLLARVKELNDAMWNALHHHRSLRWLTINLPPSTLRMPLVSLYPLLQRLHGLDLRGDWYEREGEHMGDQQPWAMLELSIKKQDLNLAVYCPRLQVVRLRPHQSQDNTPFSLAPIKSCPQLCQLWVEETSPHQTMTDVKESLVSCHMLQVLSINIGLQEQADFLSLFTDTDPSTMPLPPLSTLNVTFLSAHAHLEQRLQQLIIGALQSRHHLRALKIERISIDPVFFFTSSDSGAQADWNAKLETLQLQFLFRDASSDESKKEAWRAFYAKVGQCACLEALTITCSGINLGSMEGIHQMNTATALKELTLIDSGRQFWSEDDVTTLLEACPYLDTLNLTPFNSYNRNIIKGVLNLLGRETICL